MGTIQRFTGGSGYTVFSGNDDGTTNNATALETALIAAKTSDGVASVFIPAGNYRVEWDVDVDTLIAAGVSKIILRGAGGAATRFNHRINNRCIDFDLSGRASAARTVSAISLQTYDTYNLIHRLSVPDASLFEKGDRCIIHSLDHPEYDTTKEKWVGEGFRIKNIDTASNYLWVDGRLEYANDSLYATNMMVYGMSQELSIEIYDIGFYPNTPTEPVSTARDTQSVSVYLAMATDCRIENCVFDDPWWISVWFKSSIDCIVKDCKGLHGVNYPTISGKITYFTTFYGSCYNCIVEGCDTEGYRHVVTTDGDGSADATANSTSFTTTNGSATVTVSDTSHGLVAGDYVRFNTSTAANNVTISGTYQVQTVPNSSSFTITAGTTANASGSFGTSVAYSQYRASLIEQYGQPSNCKVLYCTNDASHGAPWDTHIEGANTLFKGCVSTNPHTSDTAGFVGCHMQNRARRTTIEDCDFMGGNGGINVKVSEHGANNWLRIYNTKIRELSYTSDQGRGLYITQETAGYTNNTRILMEGAEFALCGISMECDVAADIEGSYTSRRPHRGHIDLATGSVMNTYNVVWDSRSQNLPGATTQNRTLHGIITAGTVICRILGMKHILGSDTAKHTPQKFDAATISNGGIFATDNATGKTIKLTGYEEIDPSGIGARKIMEGGRETDFTVEAIEFTVPRIRTITAAGAVTALLEDNVIAINKTVGAATAVSLPASPYTGKTLIIKDKKGDAATNNITITPAAGNIDGSATLVLNTNRQSVTLQYDGSEWVIV